MTFGQDLEIARRLNKNNVEDEARLQIALDAAKRVFRSINPNTLAKLGQPGRPGIHFVEPTLGAAANVSAVIT